LIAAAKREAGVAVWAYCLMPNHVHLVVVPARSNSLSALFGEAHRRYTRKVNDRDGWCGHLWQERFHSCVMDERHLVAAVRYVEMNPVRAGLCRVPEDWRWSSVHAHLAGSDDALVTAKPMLDRVTDWPAYLRAGSSPCELEAIRSNSRTGRPLGEQPFVEHLEALTGRELKPKKSGPKPA
jgi:putative transposase